MFVPTVIRQCALVVALVAGVALSRAEAAGPRIFLAVDGEGIAGVGSLKNQNPKEGEFKDFVRTMTDDINAIVDTSFQNGASKVAVHDLHDVLNPTELDPRSVLVRTATMGRGCDLINGYDLVFLHGQHGSVDLAGAVLGHSLSPFMIDSMKLNGARASESLLIAACAGAFNVPVVFVSGDDKTIDEVHRTVDPAIIGVVVKKGLGMYTTESLHPKVARELIKQGVKDALAQGKSIKPFKLKGTPSLEVELVNFDAAEELALVPIPGLERLGVRTYRYSSKSALDCVHFAFFLARYSYGRPAAY